MTMFVKVSESLLINLAGIAQVRRVTEYHVDVIHNSGYRQDVRGDEAKILWKILVDLAIEVIDDTDLPGETNESAKDGVA